MSLVEFLRNQIKSSGPNLGATEAIPAGSLDKQLKIQPKKHCPPSITLNKTQLLAAIPLDFIAANNIGRWESRLSERLDQIARRKVRDVYFSEEELAQYRKVISAAVEIQKCSLPPVEPSLIEYIDGQGSLSQAHQTFLIRFCSEYPSLLSCYGQALVTLQRLFPISPTNLDCYDYFRIYHRHEVEIPSADRATAKHFKTPEQLQRANIVMLESALLRRSMSPPKTWMIPYLTGQLKDFARLAEEIRRRGQEAQC